ncbi:homeobox-DDT domain protein RLT2 isoform X2 [Mercurialis annua]|uniref:homeobox-DDT domain protein RLT2 isoform X2 n=1 Tax=Mercurialis annua TaxID=3986 RepID=UPI002160A1D6|nr:homeobox-DDT domain protein RLT2 isoform X2 [Mercurialis annua]
MEVAGGRGGGGDSAGDGSEAEKKTAEGGGGEVNKSKRKMKTASQLEILEKTYAVETYPSEELRAELSVQLGLTDRQLQMWFCHRRLKDRKGPPIKRQRKDESPAPSATQAGQEMGVETEVRNEVVAMHASASSPFTHGMDSRRVVTRTPGVAVARISTDMSAMKRYYESQQSISELRAMAFVEAQLGEPFREDGPILGMEFDPLPPDAFGAPIAAVGQQKHPGWALESNLYEHPDVKTIKTTRPLHEYQFLPQQPTGRADAYERLTPSYHYSSPADNHNVKSTALPSARSFMHANEQVTSGYGFSSPLPSLNLMPQESRQGHLLPSSATEYDTVLRKSSLTNIGVDAHPITALDNPFTLPDRRVTIDEDVLRIERKRKSEEARIAREVEAHEKRIRKELEKQDILRRKREEQIKKEMERHDRERRKEEERLLREKQREEERYQREQRRELERRERYLQKESMRVEKMRQKEELRREKEAARQKAATQRAIARRIAKESMELLDDERIELMELAASSKGLPSAVSLDFETLQNLDLFRDKLVEFPPKSVLLKKPFAIQPWNDSEENVGNLLMVWRFLITFTDVLGLWPFTLDEFVQAFHDFDPRLLGEIHVALLKTIIKDIEDVARTPSTGIGANQNSAANPGGGHPQIVEGAYAWGFDIRSWQRHLNPLTWPEILRQFALSARFGPQLKKRNVEPGYVRDENEGNDGEDVITNLRNGAAAENAVAIMQERGFSNSRRSRHRLTPGTVKFAAFHILSLEGSNGLTILEVAEKIQKSGLRDLTTSKTPEASISAALSRDSKLFERTAPSTYCVHPPYRKDPADSEAILAAARERIRIFKSGIVDGEDADDAERDEDSESDMADDPDIEDLSTDLNPKAELRNSPDSTKLGAKTLSENGNESSDVIKTPQVRLPGDSLSSVHSDCNIDVKGISDITGILINVKEEDADIDESNLGEPWVQGLMEGEYSDLSVEERLNALVALIGVAIEGNSIRAILEERLEAATVLKKQMWAEAQLDKRRMKEEYVMKMHYSSFTGSKVEPNLTMSTPEVRQSPLVNVNEKSGEMSGNAVTQQEQSIDLRSEMNYLNNMPSGGNLQMQDLSNGPDNLLYMQQGLATDKSRSHFKSFIGHKAEELYVYRSLPLGQDRRRNRYWQFTTSDSCNDPGCGRIFVELHDGLWRLIDSEKGFDSLLTSLDVRGVREAHLLMMLQKIEMSFKAAVRKRMSGAVIERYTGVTAKSEAVEMVTGADSPSSTLCVADSDMSETSTSFAVELGRNQTERNHALKRYEDFEKWMWKECFNYSVLCAMKYGKKRSSQLLSVCDYCHEILFAEDDQCPCCRTCEKLRVGLDYDWQTSAVPLRIKLLKMLLAMIKVSLLPEALQPVWTNVYRKSWGMKLQHSSSVEDLLQILTSLEGSVKRDYLSSNFETTSELLGSSHPSGDAAYGSYQIENVPVLPWLPRTTAAIALRVMEFDSSISYVLHQEVESLKEKGNGDLINRQKYPPKFSIVKSPQDYEAIETPQRAGLFQEDNWADVGVSSAGITRGQGSRARGRSSTSCTKSQPRGVGSRSETSKRSITATNNKSGQIFSWKGKSRARGRKRGRRTAKSRQKPVKRAMDVAAQTSIARESIYRKIPTNLERANWNVDETRFQLPEAQNLSSSERSEYDDENGQATGDEYDHLVADDYAVAFNGKSDDLLGSDYILDPNEEEEDDEYEMDVNDDDQVDMDIEGYINGDSDDDIIRDGNEEQNGDPDEGIESSSSGFSD